VTSRSLVFRLALLQQVLAAAIILAFAASAILLSSRTLRRQEVQYLSNAANQMAEALDHEWDEEHDLRRATAAALEEDYPLGVRVDVLDAEGRLVQSTTPAARRAGPRGGHEARVHLSRGAWVVVSSTGRPPRDALTALTMALLLTAAPLFIAVTLLSRVVARRALRPLSRMATQAEHATEQGVVRPLGRPGDPDEIRRLAGSFNRLLARLEEMIRVEQHFTQDAAHELQTPLTVLSGELEYALSDSFLSARHRDGLQRAWGQVRAMSDLVEALLLLRRTDAAAPEARAGFVPVNLADLARELVQELLRRAPDRRRDVTVAAEDEVLVAGHPTLLSAALRNLLSNALKFTAPGQSVQVTVQARDARSIVTVDDAGRGIPADERERIFDPFYRNAETRPNHEGSGLGLPILRRVARAHGGDVVAVASALGGARFELSLPAWAPQG
jgi:signal transduction histidine kinase